MVVNRDGHRDRTSMLKRRLRQHDQVVVQRAFKTMVLCFQASGGNTLRRNPQKQARKIHSSALPMTNRIGCFQTV